MLQRSHQTDSQDGGAIIRGSIIRARNEAHEVRKQCEGENEKTWAGSWYQSTQSNTLWITEHSSICTEPWGETYHTRYPRNPDPR